MGFLFLGLKLGRNLGRKREAGTCLADVWLQAYVDQQHKQLQEMIEADQNRQIQKNAYLENMLRAQQEGEERRIQIMQAQQQYPMCLLHNHRIHL